MMQLKIIIKLGVISWNKSGSHAIKIKYSIFLERTHAWFTLRLKRPSLLAASIFWTFHTKSHTMKALVILSHWWSPFLPLTSLYGKNELLWVYVWPSEVFSWEKLLPDYPCKSHDHDHQWADLVMAWLL